MANSLAWIGGVNLSTNLLGYYRLDEAAGANDAIDATGNGRTLTQINSPGSAPAVMGNGRSFVASSSQTFTRPDEPALRIFSGDFTVAGWVKFSSVAHDNMLASKIGAASPNFEFQITYLSVQNEVYTALFDTSGGPSISCHTVIGGYITGVAYYLASRRFGNTLAISVNAGSESTVDVSSLGTIGGNGPFDLGSQHANASPDYLDGTFMDGWGIWNRALTTTEIALLYNSGSGRDPVTTP